MEKNIKDKATEKTEKGMKILNEIKEIVADENKGKIWAKKMAWIETISNEGEKPDIPLISGLIGGEFTQAEVVLGMTMLLTNGKSSTKTPKNDMAFM